MIYAVLSNFDFVAKFTVKNLNKGCHQNRFSEKLGLLAQPADPPPQKLGRQKKKKKFNVYFAF